MRVLFQQARWQMGIRMSPEPSWELARPLAFFPSTEPFLVSVRLSFRLGGVPPSKGFSNQVLQPSLALVHAHEAMCSPAIVDIHIDKFARGHAQDVQRAALSDPGMRLAHGAPFAKPPGPTDAAPYPQHTLTYEALN